jgi:PhoH-like ATPase
MIKKRRGLSPVGERVFVLDTNVLVHDPAAMFRFHEHDIHIPAAVIEELDSLKRGTSDVARNARQASRYLDDLLVSSEVMGFYQLAEGIDLSQHIEDSSDLKPTGKLTLQPWRTNGAPGADNAILAAAIDVRDQHPTKVITVVSKDINLRIKAAAAGVHAEDYLYDSIDESAAAVDAGFTRLPGDFWQKCGPQVESWESNGRAYYEVTCDLVREWSVNQFLAIPGDNPLDLIVHSIDGDKAVLVQVENFMGKSKVWGISARNKEQNYALNLLMDPEIDFVALTGPAGTGKTLLTLAAALSMTADGESTYQEIIVTRVTIPLGEDIGFLPGTEEEKMTPWMGALADNLEVLNPGSGNKWETDVTNELLRRRIKVRSINFMRGRTFLNRFVIVDEAQNLTPKQMKALITRAGPGTKIVCLGDVEQIDTPYLDTRTSGLTYAIQRMKGWKHGGYISLQRGERSRLAQFAATSL